MNIATTTGVLDGLVSWLAKILEIRLTTFLGNEPDDEHKVASPVLNWNGDPHPLAKFCALNELTEDEFIVLGLALISHIDPYIIDKVIQEKFSGGSLPQIGGVRGQNQRSFLPTGETALFILAENDIEKRIAVQQLFAPDHFFAKRQVLWLEEVPEGESRLSGKIVLSDEYVDLFTIGKINPPKFSSEFPAKKITTLLSRKDLIIAESTSEKLLEIERWLKHNEWLSEETQLGKRLKPGYRALFYGPPGTGKTLAASILGNEYNCPVYRIDLSQIISKYIGETEKNLSRLFDKAENKNWILFFDEADALFGKRVNVKEAKDKYANQETAYLLQRIEDYPGLVVLATNLKDNIDKAFMRRFHSVIHFPFPTAEERLRLWKATLPQQDNPEISLSPTVRLENIAQRYKLTGANINNIVQYCCYYVKEQGIVKIDTEVLIKGIRREFEKDAKS